MFHAGIAWRLNTDLNNFLILEKEPNSAAEMIRWILQLPGYSQLPLDFQESEYGLVSGKTPSTVHLQNDGLLPGVKRRAEC